MTKYQSYLFDLGLLVKERSLEAVRQRNAEARGSSRREYEAGRLRALAEVVSLMQQQAQSIGIGLHELQLDDIVPDRDLT